MPLAAETTAAGCPESASRPAGWPAARVRALAACTSASDWVGVHARTPRPLLISFTPGPPASPPSPTPTPAPHPPRALAGEGHTHTHTAVMQAQAHARTRSSSSRSSRRWPLARSCCQASCRAQAHGFRLRRAALTPGAHRSCCRMHALLDASSISAY